MSNFPSGLLVVLTWTIICCVVYVIPSVVAFRRNHPNRWVIFAINMAFGATIIGWIIALVWAMQAVHLSNLPGGSHGGESGLNLFVNDVQQMRIVPEPLRRAPDVTGKDDAIDMRAAVIELDRLKKLRVDGQVSAAYKALQRRCINVTPSSGSGRQVATLQIAARSGTSVNGLSSARCSGHLISALGDYCG
jgi:hypothetical protein